MPERVREFLLARHRRAGVRDAVLARYIAKELFLYFFICFLFFFVVFLVNQLLLLAEKILQMRVPVPSVLRLMWYFLPNVVALSMPFATLVGFLMCVGRMASDNELLILRASGLRYSFVLIPVVAMGALISVFSFVMNDYFLPLGTLKYNRLYRQIIRSNPAVELEPQSIKRMNGATLVIGMVDGDDVSDLVFFDERDPALRKAIIAGNSTVRKSASPGVLMELYMEDVLVLALDPEKRGTFDMVRADSLSMNIFDSTIIAASPSRTPREMTSYDLRKEIVRLRDEGNLSPGQLNMYGVEFHKKFSFPFASIFFALLAFPLAIAFGRKDGRTVGLIVGLIISVAYWAAYMLGQMFGIRSGYDGFWMMWGPDFAVGIVGLLLYARVRRT